MFNRTAIMQDAWRRWRSINATYADWQIGPGRIGGTFADCLRTAWRVAKKEAREARALVGPNAAQIARLRRELDWLNYKPSHMNISPRQTEIYTELASLMAAA